MDGTCICVHGQGDKRKWNLEEMVLDDSERQAALQYVSREAARTAWNLLVKRDYAEVELYRKLRDKGYSEFFCRERH